MARKSIYSRLRSYCIEKREPEMPSISSTTAIILLVIYTIVYVVPFYLSSTTRPSQNLSRDAPSVIRARIRSVTVSCVGCSLTTLTLLSLGQGYSTAETLHLMGYLPIGMVEAGKSLGLTSILFLGPLFEAGIVEGGWRDWVRLRGLDNIFNGWIGWRNMVAGPITEEVLFRSAAVPLLLSRTSNSTIIFLTPIVFGLAHFHHFYEFRITHPNTPVFAAILRSVLQLSYTTLFGGYVTFLYLRTGSLLAVILVHAFCNWMGLPRFWGRVTTGELPTRSGFGNGKRSEDKHNSHDDGELSLIWTFAYYIMLVVGAASWWRYLWPFTQSDMALSKF